MEILYLLIPVSIVLVFVIGAIFWWALNNRQFDDLEDQGNLIFEDDDLPKAQTEIKETSASTDLPPAQNLQSKFHSS